MDPFNLGQRLIPECSKGTCTKARPSYERTTVIPVAFEIIRVCRSHVSPDAAHLLSVIDPGIL